MTQGRSTINPRVYALTFTAFVMLSSEFIVAGLLPQIATSLAITIGATSGLVTAFALGMGISAPIIGVLAHRASKRSLLISACVALVLGNGISAAFNDYYIILAGRVLGGIGVAVFWTNAALAAKSLSQGRNESLAIGRVLVGISIASVVGVPVGKLIADATNWRMAMWMMTALSSVALLTVWIWVRPTEESRQKENLSDTVRVALRSDVAMTLISSCLMFAGVASVFNFLATFMEKETGFGEISVTLLLCLYGIADIASNLILSKRVKDDLEPLFRRVLMTMAAGMCFLSLFGSLTWAVPIAVIIVASSHAGVSLLIGIDVLQRAGDAGQLINAINVSMINLGIGIGAAITGLLTDRVGVGAVGWVGACFILLALSVRWKIERSQQTHHG
ncbi:MFS transporter [Pseudomonas syringae]|uniref:MFS transporter n=1 Tax=Pseudomonas syringae TaxID=317 RepID=UPI003F7703D2